MNLLDMILFVCLCRLTLYLFHVIVATDLVKEEVQVTFPAGKTTVDASIEIVDDEIAECPEMFKLELEIPGIATGNGVVAIAPNTAEIMIMDNDGMK